MKNHKPKAKNGGQALLTAVILFLFVSLTAVIGVSDTVLRQAGVTDDFLNSRKGYFAAEAGIEDIAYRIKTNKQVPANQSSSLDGSAVSVSVSGSSNSKTIDAVGSYGNLVRSLETVLVTGVGSSFSYGVQAGAGGFVLGNNTIVNGSIYANGAISGSNGASITGSALSANSSSLTSNQANDTPLPPPNSIIFGKTSAEQDFAQSFKLSSAGSLTKVSLYIEKVGLPPDLTLRITSDNAGKPSNNTIVSATLSSSLVTSSFGWVDVSLGSYPDLLAGATYWLVLDGGNSSSKYYTVGANTNYPSGNAMLGQYGGSWSVLSPSNISGYFRVYFGGLTGSISGVSVGSGGVGDASAYQVTNSIAAGHLYCQTGSSNNKSCDTSKPPPTELDFPISDGNISEWKNDATAGGVINGDYTVSSSGSLGAKKIIGNLTISGNVTLTLLGTVYVTGNINVQNGAKVALASSYGTNSGVLLSDGTVSISNNAAFAGSGTSGSYILVLTTSNCPTADSCAGSYAIDVSNNAGAVILNAEQGTIHMNNGATVKEVTAYKTIFDNNSIINYESGIANINFVSGPTGGWNIKSWQEVE